MDALTTLTSRTVVLPIRDIDTDQIIPARFLTTTSREGLGAALFHDLRFDQHGAEREDFPLNDPDARDCRILVAGNNFGCGSSREHAPWALLDYGFRAVISMLILITGCLRIPASNCASMSRPRSLNCRTAGASNTPLTPLPVIA